MKYLAALLVVLGTAGSAQAASLLRCAIWIVPDRTCSLEERVIGGAILTAGVGAIIGSAGAATGLITFSASIATTAGAGALIGGATGTVGALIVR
tara:strand:+ start:2675 stop:2959 length:285 start_codon:yes stop_codon:yes gene_type:complete